MRQKRRDATDAEMSMTRTLSIQHAVVCTSNSYWKQHEMEKSVKFDATEKPLIYISTQDGTWQAIHEL